MGAARILVADDDPAIRASLGVALAAFGYSAVLANDGAAALRAARADPPDLILLDYMMPRMDGLAVLAALQADPRLRTIPVVFLTGVPEDIPMLPGVAAVLEKPVRLGALEALEETLRSILKARPPG